jgi:hypothetical protein
MFLLICFENFYVLYALLVKDKQIKKNDAMLHGERAKGICLIFDHLWSFGLVEYLCYNFLKP